MGPPSTLDVVRDAIEIVRSRLSALRPSPEVEELRTKAEAQRWQSWTAEERENLMKRVLALHIAVGKLERMQPG